MRDAIELARNGLPVAAFVTSKFWPQGDFIAKAEGMPDVPRVALPHPVAGIGQAAMTDLANEICTAVLKRLSDG